MATKDRHLLKALLISFLIVIFLMHLIDVIRTAKQINKANRDAVGLAHLFVYQNTFYFAWMLAAFFELPLLLVALSLNQLVLVASELFPWASFQQLAGLSKTIIVFESKALIVSLIQALKLFTDDRQLTISESEPVVVQIGEISAQMPDEGPNDARRYTISQLQR